MLRQYKGNHQLEELRLLKSHLIILFGLNEMSCVPVHTLLMNSQYYTKAASERG